jgi:hypothetical protein
MATKEAPAKEAPAKKGIAWLSEHVEGVLGEPVAPTKLRVLLRNLVASGEVEHEAGQGWTFTGIKDPAVRGVVAKLKEQAKAEEKPKAKAAPAKRTSRAKAKAAPEPEDIDEDELDDEDIDLD